MAEIVQWDHHTQPNRVKPSGEMNMLTSKLQTRTLTHSNHNSRRWLVDVLAMTLALTLVALSLMAINRYIEAKTSNADTATIENVESQDYLVENMAPSDQSPTVSSVIDLSSEDGASGSEALQDVENFDGSMNGNIGHLGEPSN